MNQCVADIVKRTPLLIAAITQSMGRCQYVPVRLTAASLRPTPIDWVIAAINRGSQKLKGDVMALEAGLYIVATPIGNLADITSRAVDTLGAADLIAAEDTRHSKKLLQHLGINTRLVALHEHNERTASAGLIETILQGKSIALVSDAGTPLLSDPGYYLVRSAREAGVRVIPVPGVSAAICALSAAGLPTDRFVFEGFLPARQTARRHRLEQLGSETRTLIVYESSHRIVDSLQDMLAIFGGEREAVVARELTKTFETIRDDNLAGLVAWLTSDSYQQKGEFVVLVRGDQLPENNPLTTEAEHVLRCLLEELSVKQASKLASKITGVNKRLLYDRAVELKK